MSLMGEMGDKKMFLDSVFAENDFESLLVSSKKYQNINKSLKSTLFSRGRRTESFFTEDSKLYITPKQQKLIDEGIMFNEKNVFDGISARIVGEYRQFRPKEDDFLYQKLLAKYEEIKNGFADLPQNFSRRLSLVRLWNFSMISAVIIGMVSMTFIYRYLGVGAAANGDTNKIVSTVPIERVLGEEDVKTDQDITKYIEDIIKDLEETKKSEFEEKIERMVKGYPIEKMVPYLMEKDQTVAIFYIAIAKKESNWGKRVPVLDGRDCYNYLGYRGQRKLMGTGGHTCFDSPKDAVDTITKRLDFLIKEKNLNTPAKLSIWKCGSACNKDGQVGKWISDVSLYHDKLD